MFLFLGIFLRDGENSINRCVEYGMENSEYMNERMNRVALLVVNNY